MSCARNHKLETLVVTCFFIVLLGVVYYYATKPLADPDLWWHLKSGELMVQQGGLLQEDPFTFSGDGQTSSREKIILTGYWLWQLIAFKLYSLFSFKGIYLLNFITIIALIGVVTFQMRTQRTPLAIICLLLALGLVPFSQTHYLERPQAISFLFAAILLGILAKARDGERIGWSLPLLMLLWANIHGGFLVGDLILFCFSLGVLYQQRKNLARARHLLLWVSISIGTSLLSPNGWRVFGEVFTFSGSELQTGITEYLSTWARFQSGEWGISLLWMLVGLYLGGIAFSRRFEAPELLVVFFLIFFSCAYARNVGFFVLPILPFIARHLQLGLQRISFTPRLLTTCFLILTAVVPLLWIAKDLRQAHAEKGDVSGFYPKQSSDFILQSGLQGHILNFYDYGGYQIWRLYPKYKVFIDGRGMEPQVYHDYKKMTSASRTLIEGRREYEALLDQYAIDVVVQPFMFRSGRLTPLQKFLLPKPEWVPIYRDQNVFILVRQGSKNAGVIARYQMDKLQFCNETAESMLAAVTREPRDVRSRVGLVEFLIYIGRYAEAGKHLEVLAAMVPDNVLLAPLRNQLEVLSRGKKQG